MLSIANPLDPHRQRHETQKGGAEAETHGSIVDCYTDARI